MKQLFLALVLTGTALPALADGNGGPQTPNSPFLVWQKQGGDRQALTPLATLNQQANRDQVVAGSVPQNRVN